MSHSLDATFDDQIQLLGYDLKHEGETLKIDLAWKALRNIDQNYAVFAHVFDPATEQIVAQWDAMPRNNAYPTSRWVEGEVVTETLSIPLTGVSAGEYRVAIRIIRICRAAARQRYGRNRCDESACDSGRKSRAVNRRIQGYPRMSQSKE